MFLPTSIPPTFSINSLQYRALVVVSAALLLAGCGYISKDGPYRLEVDRQAQIALAQPAQQVAYARVAISPLTLAEANRSTTETAPWFGSAVGPRRATSAPIAIGDVLTLTIFEASSGGLFIPSEAGSRAGNFVATPNQEVDRTGSINVPYAGAIHVAGRTPQEVSRTIQDALKNRAIEPQVIVTVAERRGNEISVLGEVNAPTRVPLDPSGLQVLSALARAGGPKFPAYETLLTLQRGSRTERAMVTDIVKNPSQNVTLKPGDVVYVSHEPKIFMVFGATPSPGSVGGINNRRFAFDNDNMTFAEGVAKAGGLAQERADPSAVYLFRFETTRTLAAMGVDVSHFTQPLVAAVYVADLSRPDGLFLMNSFYLRHRDIIFVSDAPATDVNKFLSTLQNVASIYNGAGTGAYYFGGAR